MLEDYPPYQFVTQAFPHIGVKLKEYWGRDQFVAYMEGLLHGTRGGTRRGFHVDVLMALQTLAERHKAAYPKYAVADDFWAYVECKPTVPER